MAERIKARHRQEEIARTEKLKKMAKKKVPNILTAKKVEKKLASIMYNKVGCILSVGIAFLFARPLSSFDLAPG